MAQIHNYTNCTKHFATRVDFLMHTGTNGESCLPNEEQSATCLFYAPTRLL